MLIVWSLLASYSKDKRYYQSLETYAPEGRCVITVPRSYRGGVMMLVPMVIKEDHIQHVYYAKNKMTLSMMYTKGIGVAKSPMIAVAW